MVRWSRGGGPTCCFTGRHAASYHLVWMFQHLCRQPSGPRVSLAATVFTIAAGGVDHVLQMRKLRCGGGWVSDFCEVTRCTGVQAHEMGALILSRSPSITLRVLQGKFTVIPGGWTSRCKPSSCGAWDSGLRVQACEPCGLRHALGRLWEPGSEDVGLGLGEGKQRAQVGHGPGCPEALNSG